ncbi:MAG: prolipoprotein diacylglyceryl transferase [Chloroflexota bacterium]|nr:prolipoprotein diacylglyceryl transferase [Chloroflexota bacterium]MDE2969628.1 prolipoprotein diacylglyceryl transferase [Chloroflexota bacterium]
MIEIGIDPNIFEAGGIILSWHGLFSVIAVAVAVWLTTKLAPRNGISADDVLSVAVWAIIGGVIGARLLHIVDKLDYYTANPLDIFAIWSGGIAVWGGVLGGLLGGWIYASRAGIVRGRLADVTAPGLLLAMAIGRIGDIINGEHLSHQTDLPWGFVYTHPGSLSFGRGATHPAVVYEMMLDLVVVGLAMWVLPKYLRPDGMVFAASLLLYAFGRFFILILHDYNTWFWSMSEAQIVSLAVVLVTLPLLVWKGRFGNFGAPEPVGPVPDTRRPRAERRRRGR